MRVKLLRKLRSRFFIQKRNNEYRVKDSNMKYPFDWGSLELSTNLRRYLILRNARKHKKAKQFNITKNR